MHRPAARNAALSFHTLRPRDLAEIEADPGQASLGLQAELDEAARAEICAQPVAWAVRDRGRLIACFGIVESFAGKQGWGWANLAPGIGTGHLGLTRFVAGQIAACGLNRLEVLARAADLESELARFPELDAGQIVALALRKATREVRWGVLLGLRPAHVLRRFGAAGETYMLFERIA